MSNLNAKHYLDIYAIRLRMQEKGATNPPEETKVIVRTIVENLSRLPPDEIIILDYDRMMDSHGNVIAELPK